MKNNVEKTPSMLDIIVTLAENCVRSVREHSTSLINKASMMTFASRMVELFATMTAKDVSGLVKGRVFFDICYDKFVRGHHNLPSVFHSELYRHTLKTNKEN